MCHANWPVLVIEGQCDCLGAMVLAVRGDRGSGQGFDRVPVFFPAPHREAARSVAVSPHGTVEIFCEKSEWNQVFVESIASMMRAASWFCGAIHPRWRASSTAFSTRALMWLLSFHVWGERAAAPQLRQAGRYCMLTMIPSGSTRFEPQSRHGFGFMDFSSCFRVAELLGTSCRPMVLF